MDDDLAIAPALGAVFELVRDLNRRIADRTLSTADARRAAAALRDLDRVLGVMEPDEACRRGRRSAEVVGAPGRARRGARGEGLGPLGRAAGRARGAGRRGRGHPGRAAMEADGADRWPDLTSRAASGGAAGRGPTVATVAARARRSGRAGPRGPRPGDHRAGGAGRPGGPSRRGPAPYRRPRPGPGPTGGPGPPDRGPASAPGRGRPRAARPAIGQVRPAAIGQARPAARPADRALPARGARARPGPSPGPASGPVDRDPRRPERRAPTRRSAADRRSVRPPDRRAPDRAGYPPGSGSARGPTDGRVARHATCRTATRRPAEAAGATGPTRPWRPRSASPTTRSSWPDAGPWRRHSRLAGPAAGCWWCPSVVRRSTSSCCTRPRCGSRSWRSRVAR